MVSDLIALSDLTQDEILGILELGEALQQKQKNGEEHRLLAGKSLAMIFEKPSLRTRVTFELGIFQLGGHGVHIETKLGERESVSDVARNLDRWVDGITARTYSHAHLVELAEHAEAPVINALTDLLHPCQILADAMALRAHKGHDLGSLKVAFVGDGNNVYHSWANFAARVPLNLTLVCPAGYEPDPAILEAAQRDAKGQLEVTRDVEAGLKDADAVYTDVWASMGQEEEVAERAAVFAPYQVNSALMALAKPDAVFMHCLPAHRGSEVTDDVMDGPQCVAFDQAENRLHAQKAIMATLMG